MRRDFLDLLSTPAVRAAQERSYGAARILPPRSGPRQDLGPDEAAFIAARDSFYLASIGESGWPYVQHRGGPPGFLHLASPTRLVMADYRGNRQLLSTGNIAAGGRVALFLMDYVARERLKILGTARVVTFAEARELAPGMAVPDGVVCERGFVIEVVGFDWNCPKYITPRFSEQQVREMARPLQEEVERLRHRVAELEAAGPCR
jgi:predicted pyridoxine 5'-phosphate oxidase superfamily flavin-nucleotide-binding protein